MPYSQVTFNAIKERHQGGAFWFPLLKNALNYESI